MYNWKILIRYPNGYAVYSRRDEIGHVRYASAYSDCLPGVGDGVTSIEGLLLKREEIYARLD